MNEPTTIGAALVLIVEMRWAIARLGNRVAALEDARPLKARRSSTIARAGLWMIAGALALSGCAGREGAPALAATHAAVAGASGAAAAVLDVVAWSAGVLAVGAIVCAVLSVVLKEWHWLLGSLACAAGIAAAVGLEWLMPFLPWLVLAAVVIGAAAGAWRIYRSKIATALAAAHGDRLESLHVDAGPDPLALMTAKLDSLKEQAAAGLHGLIASARGKNRKA